MNNESGFGLARQLLLLLGFFLIGLFIATLLSTQINGVIVGNGSRNAILIHSVCQNVFAFMLPAWGSMKLLGKNAFGLLGMEKGFSLRGILGIVIAVILGTAALNQIIFWNSELHLPAAFKEIEELWRRLENESTAFTQQLVSDPSVWGLVSGLLCVGLITGIGEEMFFRGALQGSLQKFGLSSPAAIWITAIVFSLMHFQMFGFVPRVLLGAWFGYLYVWSGSLWLSVLAHALNNSLVVLFSWLSLRGLINEEFDMAGVAVTGFPWIPLLSALLFSLFLYYCKGIFKPSGKNSLFLK